MPTFQEGSELLDIGDRCGDGFPTSTCFVITDSNEQCFLRRGAASGGDIATGGRYGEGGLHGNDEGGRESGWLSAAHVLYSAHSSFLKNWGDWRGLVWMYRIDKDIARDVQLTTAV